MAPTPHNVFLATDAVETIRNRSASKMRPLADGGRWATKRREAWREISEALARTASRLRFNKPNVRHLLRPGHWLADKAPVDQDCFLRSRECQGGAVRHLSLSARLMLLDNLDNRAGLWINDQYVIANQRVMIAAQLLILLLNVGR